MPIPVQCPCGETLNVRDELAGRVFRCPGCGRNHDVPASPAVRQDVPRAAAPVLPGPPSVGVAPAGSSPVKFAVFIGVFLGLLLIAGVVTFLVMRQRAKSDDDSPRGAEGFGSAERRDRNLQNLRQIGLALHNYHQAWNSFPPAVGRDLNGNPLSWRVAILPYVEEDPLYQTWNMHEPWDGPNNRLLWARTPRCYQMPGRKGDGTKTYYQVFVGPGALFEPNVPVRITDVTDGTSNTIMVAEASSPVVWCEPGDIPFQASPNGFDPQQVGGWFGKNVNVVMADGAVRPISWKVSPQMFQAAITRRGGEVVFLDD